MLHPRRCVLSFFAASTLFLAGTVAASAESSDALKIINIPGGGQVVYGLLTAQNSMADAMVFMLKQVHGHFGDRPQIGKFFQARGSNSTAVFFNLTAKN